MELTLDKHSNTYRDLWGLILLAAIALALSLVALWMLISQYDLWPQEAVSSDPLGVSQTVFTEETGIRIIRVNVTLGGGALSLRYQVVDPDKAIIIHDEDYPPGFEVESTGQIFNVQWHEHSHDQELHPGVTYYELLKNDRGVIQPGEKVTILVGTSRLEHVVIQ